MTLVLIGKGLLLEDSIPKTKDKQVPGKYQQINLNVSIFFEFIIYIYLVHVCLYHFL